MSAGFGYTGLVGPINALNRMSGDTSFNIILLIIGYFVVPFIGAFIIHHLCKDLFIHIAMKSINLKYQKNKLLYA